MNRLWLGRYGNCWPHGSFAPFANCYKKNHRAGGAGESAVGSSGDCLAAKRLPRIGWGRTGNCRLVLFCQRWICCDRGRRSSSSAREPRARTGLLAKGGQCPPSRFWCCRRGGSRADEPPVSHSNQCFARDQSTIANAFESKGNRPANPHRLFEIPPSNNRSRANRIIPTERPDITQSQSATKDDDGDNSFERSIEQCRGRQDCTRLVRTQLGTVKVALNASLPDYSARRRKFVLTPRTDQRLGQRTKRGQANMRTEDPTRIND